MSEAANGHIPVHPLIAKLTESAAEPGASPEAPVKLSGYVGPASQSGMVRLYPTLSGLSHYFEFPEDAVVHTAEAPETVLPNGATSVWVRASAPVRWTREYPNASGMETSIADSIQRQAATANILRRLSRSRAVHAKRPIPKS